MYDVWLAIYVAIFTCWQNVSLLPARAVFLGFPGYETSQNPSQKSSELDMLGVFDSCGAVHVGPTTKYLGLLTS